jgi:TetR/AcrR family transcriptional regulator, repressor for neighboring sulfatase
LAERGPDAVGLKDVASAAGVSHALVSHYFGTYEALVEAALEDHLTRHREQMLARMVAAVGEGPVDWLALAFEHFAEPLTARLLIWAMMTGRLERDDFVTFRQRGLAQMAAAIEAHLAARGEQVSREEVELGLLAGLSATIGYSLGRGPLWGSLGKRANAENDRRFREFLAERLLVHLKR